MMMQKPDFRSQQAAYEKARADRDEWQKKKREADRRTEVNAVVRGARIHITLHALTSGGPIAGRLDNEEECLHLERRLKECREAMGK